MSESRGLVPGAEGAIPNSMLGQNEVATQIQGAMAGIQGSLMGGTTAIQGAVLESGGENPIAGQSTAASSIQASMITQSGAVGGDTIQDTIQDSIMGQAGGATRIPASLMAQSNAQSGIQSAILGQGAGGRIGETGIPDSNQYLNPAAGAMMTSVAGTNTNPSGEAGTSVSDIASQLINQYVGNTTAVFQPTATTDVAASREPEGMQTEVTPQPTHAPPVSS